MFVTFNISGKNDILFWLVVGFVSSVPVVSSIVIVAVVRSVGSISIKIFGDKKTMR